MIVGKKKFIRRYYCKIKFFFLLSFINPHYKGLTGLDNRPYQCQILYKHSEIIRQ